MKNIHDHVRVPVSQDNMCADDHAITVGWWWRQPAIQVNGNRMDFALHFWRECSADDELIFQAGRQAVLLGKARRKMPLIRCVPAANFVAIVIREAVAPAIVVVAMVLVLVPPVAVVMMIVVILAGMPSQNDASGNCE